MAIEAKFCEIFSDPHNAFRESYFESPWIWRELPNARALAREIADGRASFARLGAAQLLKHVLGLARRFGPTGFRLLYLWYEAPGGESRQHRRELDAFARGIARDFEFAELTYQQIFERLVPLEREHPAYIGYLRERYFPGAP